MLRIWCLWHNSGSNRTTEHCTVLALAHSGIQQRKGTEKHLQSPGLWKHLTKLQYGYWEPQECAPQWWRTAINLWEHTKLSYSLTEWIKRAKSLTYDRATLSPLDQIASQPSSLPSVWEWWAGGSHHTYFADYSGLCRKWVWKVGNDWSRLVQLHGQSELRKALRTNLSVPVVHGFLSTQQMWQTHAYFVSWSKKKRRRKCGFLCD